MSLIWNTLKLEQQLVVGKCKPLIMDMLLSRGTARFLRARDHITGILRYRSKPPITNHATDHARTQTPVNACPQSDHQLLPNPFVNQ